MSSEEVSRFEDGLRLMRNCSPAAGKEINWAQEHSVNSHVKINTLENLVQHARMRRNSSPTMRLSKLRKFLVGNENVSKIFERIHFDLFGIKFWKEMQKKITSKELPDVFPYTRKRKY